MPTLPPSSAPPSIGQPVDPSTALQGLRDLHLPPPPPFWPLAPGWWLALGLLLLAALGFVLWRHWRRGSGQREALRLLEQAAWRFSQEGDGSQLARELSMLLRRYALFRHPTAQAAGLEGEAWLRFLDQHGDGHTFSQGVGRTLLVAPYRPGEPVDGPSLIATVQQWIKRNR